MKLIAKFWHAATIAAAAVVLLLPRSVAAQTAAEFYAGKTVEIYIGFSVGGGYDVYARLLARHLGKHIPGKPTVVPVNMEGAGSLRATNWLYNAAPKDGTAIGTFSRGAPFDPLLGINQAKFDATRFNWVGSANDEVSVCAAWKTSPVKTFDDLKATELAVGGTSRSADTDAFARVLNGVFGTKMTVVTGYPGGNDIILAMERGEVQGRCGWSWSSIKSLHADWVKNKDISLLIQLSLAKHPDLPDVPLVMDLVQSEEQRQILQLIFSRQVMGRPFAAPPGVPEDRVAALRQAFMDTMADPAFLAEAKKAELEITPVTGERLQDLVAAAYATPPAVVAKASALLQ